MAQTTSLMRQEILEIPDAVERLLLNGSTNIQNAAHSARDLDPRFIVTVARGSSDHVCTYLKYASELLLGIPVASVGSSIASIYGVKLKLQNSLCLSVSQSGQSPDITTMTNTAQRDGALCVVITNDIHSPLAENVHHVLNLHAGAEKSVAATKTFVTSAIAGLLLLAHWKQDTELLAAINDLPDVLAKACKIDWPEVRAAIGGNTSLFTLGRGPAWAMSNEAALKFKETCQLHAESYSSAEVLHGPVSIVGAGFPVLAFAASDAAEKTVAAIADQIADKGAQVFVTSPQANTANRIDTVRSKHPLTDCLSLIVSFYAMVEQLSRSKGINPDAPRHLKKVTETV